MRIIGILGRSFCGSTLLSRLFTTIPNVASGGEMHWLVDDKSKAICVFCRKPCPVFNQAFFAQRFHQKNVYNMVWKTLGKPQVLVSSDKVPNHFARFTTPKTMDAIVLFRDLPGTCASDWKRRWKHGRTIDQTLTHYQGYYPLVEAFATQHCKSVTVVSYELLTANPKAMMAAICKKLNLPSMPAIPDDLRKLPIAHQICGNRNAFMREGISTDKSWQTELNPAQKKLIQSHPANRTYTLLKSKCLKP